MKASNQSLEVFDELKQEARPFVGGRQEGDNASLKWGDALYQGSQGDEGKLQVPCRNVLIS